MKKFFTFVAAAFAAMTINAQAISVADAITAGMALDSAATSEADYTIEGYVVNAQPFSLSYGNQIWYMADDAANTANQEFQAYGCVAIENNDTLQVLNGDKVQLTGKLFKYYNKSAAKYVIEVKNGAAAFVSKADGDHTIDKGVEQLTVAGALAIGADLAMGATSTKTYEITGYVTVMAGKDTDYEQYGNQTFWIADENNGADSNAAGAFEVYRGKAPQAVKVGDLVKVKTAVKKYNDGSAEGLIESESNAAVTIIGGEPVEEPDVVFTSADFNGQGTSGTGSEVTATKDGVTFTCNKAYGDQYGVRCYKEGLVTISSADQQIGKIVFEFATVSGKYYNGDLPEEIVVNGMEWTNTMTNQARMNKISIFFGEYDPIVPPVVELDTITVARAMEIGNALADGATTEEQYVVRGYAVSIKAYGDKYEGKQTFYMSDDATAERGDFTAYNCAVEAPGVAVGDLVLVTGKIMKYVGASYTTIEISGGTAEVVAGQGIENVVLTEKAQKVVVDGVIYIIRDNKLFNLQGAQVR